MQCFVKDVQPGDRVTFGKNEKTEPQVKTIVSVSPGMTRGHLSLNFQGGGWKELKPEHLLEEVAPALELQD